MRNRMLFVMMILLTTASIVGAETTPFYFNVQDFGAAPDGKTLCTRAIQNAVDSCAASGGGKVIIPPGNYVTAPIFLKSHVHVEIMAGATLLAHTKIDDYPPFKERWEGIERKVYASMFTGYMLKNVSITGRGTLDGQGEVWWEAHHKTRDLHRKAGIKGREPANPPGSPLKYPRPRMINFYNCQNVLIRDLTILDSPSWTIHPVYCENVTIENITIIQPYESPNTDGINPESCNNVRIFNCFVDCGDDCITIKSGYNEDGRRVGIPCQNVVISNCTFAHGRSAIGIGSETSGGVRNIAISNCVFKNTYRGLRMKTARGRGNIVENIRATNITMENVDTGISLDMFYSGDDETPQPVTVETPFFRNIRYSHITGTNIKKAGEIIGLPEAPMQGVTIMDVNLAAESGIDCKFTKNLTFRHVEINVKNGSALQISLSTEIELDNVTTRTPLKNKPVIELHNVNGAFIRDCSAMENTDIFLNVKGKTSKNFHLINNRLSRSAQPILVTDGASENIINEK